MWVFSNSNWDVKCSDKWTVKNDASKCYSSCSINAINIKN